MRLLALAVIVSILAGCSSDLLHSTDWPTLCDSEPGTPGCQATVVDAGPEAQQEAGEDVQDGGLESGLDVQDAGQGGWDAAGG